MSNGKDGTISRRSLLKLGAGLAISAASTGVASALADDTPKATSSSVARRGMRLPNRPNIIVIMTDQERHHMHWPQRWAEKNLPSLQRLKRNGLYFNRAYTAACQCSPSRAVMLTSRFAPINRVTRTFLWPGLQHKDRQPNIASLLKDKAGYDVIWKGKWHLSYASNALPGNGGEDWAAGDIVAMEKNWGWAEWNPPDGGNAILGYQPTQFGDFNGNSTLGGANPNNDGRYISGMDPADPNQTPGVAGSKSAIEFLKKRAGKGDKPFCLFVSLVNPHDVYVYPLIWKGVGYDHAAFANLGIDLPPNYADDLSTKPSVQKTSRDNFQKLSPLEGEQAAREYANFYAYLHTVVDKQISALLDTLEESGLADDTIVLRFADHGEGGLSHGMREKAYTVYEEMIHIPLIIHNRKLYPEPRQTDAFYDHLDLLPTILELAGVPNANSYALGKSIAPVMTNPSLQIRQHTAFSFDDVFLMPADVPAGHIRAIREGDWTYAVYFGIEGGPVEYELYNIKSDPLQLTNLLHGTPTPELRSEWKRLHRVLTARFVDAGNLPDSFSWPIDPTLKQA
jgi:arylsulfatase A-like enzyme